MKDTNIAFLGDKWHSIFEFHPKLGELVLIFRISNKKYVVARMETNRNKEENDEENDFYWITQHGSGHAVDEDDSWIQFPYIRTETLYD